MSVDVTIQETFPITVPVDVSIVLPILRIPPTLYPSGVVSLMIVEDSMVGLLSIIGREGDKTQYIGSHPINVLMEFNVSTGDAKDAFDQMEVGKLYRLPLVMHQQRFLDIYIRLVSKSEEYPAAGGEGALSHCLTYFVEDDWFFGILAFLDMRLAEIEEQTWPITAPEDVQITTEESSTFIITSPEDVQITTEDSTTMSIGTSLLVEIV